MKFTFTKKSNSELAITFSKPIDQGFLNTIAEGGEVPPIWLKHVVDHYFANKDPKTNTVAEDKNSDVTPMW